MGTQTPTRPPEKTDRRSDPVTARRLTMIKARNKRISLIVVSLSLCVVLLAGIVTGVYFLLRRPSKDNGKILPNVYVGGVNIGNMTPEDAKNVVQLSLIPTLTGEDMIVHLPNDSLRLSPVDTGLSLDVESLVAAAYSYGRGGSSAGFSSKWAQAESRSYHIALLPYLTLDLDYVWDTVEDFCEPFSEGITAG